MKARFFCREKIWLSIAATSVVLMIAACGSSDDGSDRQNGPASQTEQTEPSGAGGESGGGESGGNVETEAEPLVPNAFELPDNCEDLATFAQDAADAYDAAEFDSQELVDAKARFDAAVGEQVLLNCI